MTKGNEPHLHFLHSLSLYILIRSKGLSVEIETVTKDAPGTVKVKLKQKTKLTFLRAWSSSWIMILPAQFIYMSRFGAASTKQVWDAVKSVFGKEFNIYSASLAQGTKSRRGICYASGSFNVPQRHWSVACTIVLPSPSPINSGSIYICHPTFSGVTTARDGKSGGHSQGWIATKSQATCNPSCRNFEALLRHVLREYAEI